MRGPFILQRDISVAYEGWNADERRTWHRWWQCCDLSDREQDLDEGLASTWVVSLPLMATQSIHGGKKYQPLFHDDDVIKSELRRGL